MADAMTIAKWRRQNVAEEMLAVMRLGLEAGAIYQRLLMQYRANLGPLPDDDDALAGLCGVSVSLFKKHRPRLVGHFTVKSGLWRHAGEDEDITRAKGLSRKRAEAARKRHANAEQMQSNCSANGHTVTDTVTGTYSGRNIGAEGSTEDAAEQTAAVHEFGKPAGGRS